MFSAKLINRGVNHYKQFRAPKDYKNDQRSIDYQSFGFFGLIILIGMLF